MSNEKKVPRIITADEIKVGQKIAVDRFLRRGDTVQYALSDDPEVRSATGVVTEIGSHSVALEGVEFPVPAVANPHATRVVAIEITLLEDAPEPKPVYDPAKHIFIDRAGAYLATETYAAEVDKGTYHYAANLVRAAAKARKEQPRG